METQPYSSVKSENMLRGAAGTATEVVGQRQPQVTAQLERIEFLLSNIHDASYQLQERLGSVLATLPEQDCNSSEKMPAPPSMVPLAEKLKGYADSLATLVHRLSVIVERVEL